MTAQELQTLLARGAAQPGIHEVQEMMRLTLALEQQARDLASLYTAELTTVSSGSGIGVPIPAAVRHADLG
jgi:hypothetical protein